MKTAIKINVLIISLSSFFISCEKEIKNGDIPPFEQKLVLSTFLSPADNLSKVQVSSNKRIYGELGTIEDLGTVSASISDGSNEIPLSLTAGGFVFSKQNMAIKQGKSYLLKVSSSKGLESSGTCTIPYNRNINIEVDTATQISTPISGYTAKVFKLNINLTDFPGEENFYRYYCVHYTYKKTTQMSVNRRVYSGFKDEFFSDKGNDGKKISLSMVSFSFNKSIYDSSFVKIYVLTTDKDYYLYHQSLKNYSGGDDPFTEISPIYTNIKGGLGIIAGYTIDSVILRLK